MIDGLALLVAILGVAILLPTLKKIRRMLDINKNSQSVTGIVSSSHVARNMLGGPLFGTTYENIIHYLPSGASEPYEIYRRQHNLVMRKESSVGDRMEVIYDAQAPYRAYPKPEWEDAVRDIWRSAASFGMAILLLIISYVLKHL